MNDTSLNPKAILAQCAVLSPQDESYLTHPIIERFGSPSQPIYVDQCNVDISGFTYEKPLILPIVNGELELIQCAVLQDGKNVQVIPNGLAHGFAYFGKLQKDKPILITYSLEAFFQIAQTGYAVVLVILPNLCSGKKSELKAFDFEQIQYVIQQLSKAGYTQLYLPVRPENIQLEPFKQLEQNTTVKLLNQYLKIGENEFFIELSKDESIEEVRPFIDEAIELIPSIDILPKGHLAKPMKWDNGYFHVLDDGLFFLEEDSKGNEYKRYISSPILVKAKTRDDSSNNWGVLLEWVDDNGVKHVQALSMELFQTDGADLRKALAYQGVTITPNKRARDLFQCYLMSYSTGKHALCVDRVGWHGDVFVLPHTQIGQRDDSDLIVYQSNHGLDNRYQSKGTLEQWRSTVSQIVENHSLLVFSLCTAFAGQLLDDLNQQGGGFHLKGKSSKGKSTGLYLACSVWGNPKQFYRTWRATGNALEHTAYMHNDSFLVLDEIGEVANPKELGNIVYMLANGLGKGRMTKQITAKPMHQWKVIFLSSGEKSLKDIMQEQGQKTKLGQEIRLADIDIDQSEYGIFDCLDFAEDGAKQSIELISRMNDCYGVAGIAWLEYLTSHKKHIIAEATELLNQYRDALSVNQVQGHIKRVASYFAIVATAGELASKANITGWKTGTAFNAVQKVFNQWLNGFEKVGNYEDVEILAHIKAFFEAHGASRFEPLVTIRHVDGEVIQQRINNRVGYYDQESKQYLVSTTMFKKEICNGISESQAKKVLKQYGWLECEDGRYTKRVKSNLPDGTRPTVMHFSAVAIQNFSDEITETLKNGVTTVTSVTNESNSLILNDKCKAKSLSQSQNATVTTVTGTQKNQIKTDLVTPVTMEKSNCDKHIDNKTVINNNNLNSDVTLVTPVTAKNTQILKNNVSDTLREEVPKPKKQVKAKPIQPEKVVDTKTIDIFGGGL